MKVLNVCQDDWANFAYDNSVSLRSVGIKADSINRNKHLFDYDNQSIIQPDVSKICEMIQDYDVIQFFHDNVSMFNAIKNACAGKRLIVYHTSSYYRKNYTAVDHLMNIYAEKAVCAMPEFMPLCTHKHKIYMVGAVDTDTLKPDGKEFNNAMFAHYPSNPKVKGTPQIVNMMQDLGIKENFNYSYDIIPYKENIVRMIDCNVYIEMFSMIDGMGSPYGNFGISALEAAALGKIVITNCLGIRIYKEYYGSIGLDIANTEEEFREKITEMSNFSKEEIILKQNHTRDWVVKNHSYKASGEYILKNVL